MAENVVRWLIFDLRRAKRRYVNRNYDDKRTSGFELEVIANTGYPGYFDCSGFL
jgi:hypothetical protein